MKRLVLTLVSLALLVPALSGCCSPCRPWVKGIPDRTPEPRTYTYVVDRECCTTTPCPGR